MFKTFSIFSFLVSFLFLSLNCGMMDMTNPDADEFDVQIIGDSVFDLDGFIHSHLVPLSGKSYKDNAKSGDTMDYITQQYDKAISRHPSIRTIIMDGGGNDILINLYWRWVCSSSTWSCSSKCKRYINGILDDAEELLEEMDADGVDDIIYMGYYYLKRGLLGDGTKLKGVLKYAMDKASLSCAVSPANCWFVDPRPDFWGNERGYIKSDGIHPSDTGGEVLANLIWDEMVSQDVYR